VDVASQIALRDHVRLCLGVSTILLLIEKHALIITSKPCDLHDTHRSHPECGVSPVADTSRRVQDMLLDNSRVLIYGAMVSCVPASRRKRYPTYAFSGTPT